jgi:hypothetical protein
MKTQKAVLICVIALVVCGVIWTKRAEGTVSPIPQKRNSVTAPASGGISEQIYYGEVFSLLAKLKNKADYQEKASLTEEEAATLQEIAADCERETAAVDAQAQAIIKEFSERWHSAKKSLPLPPELTELQRQRDAIPLHHRDRLRKALGEDAFGRFIAASKNIVHISLAPAK